jgi:predicted transcriptional regulator
MYSEQEFDFIDNLLKSSLNNDYTYTKLCYSTNFDYDLYTKLFTDINKDPNKLIELFDDSFNITPLGRKVSAIGFKQYLETQTKNDDLSQKIKEVTLENIKWTSIRGWVAIVISGIALTLASLTFYINVYAKSKDDNAENKTNLTNEGIKVAPINNVTDTVSSKIIPDSSKHNINNLKVGK